MPTVERLAIVRTAVEILDPVLYNFCQGVLRYTNSNIWKESLMTKAKSTSAAAKKSSGFTEEELGAMKSRARELKAEARADKRFK